MRYRLLFLLLVMALAFGVWATWIADDGMGLFARRSPPPDHAEFLAKLAEPTTLSARDVPLLELLDQIAARHDVEIRLDVDGLANPNAVARTRVSVEAKNVSLGSAIRIALRKAGTTLRLEIAGDSLLVTDADSIGTHPENYIGRVYPLASLMSARDRIDTEDLRDLITGAVLPHTWSDAGGLADIKVLPGGLAVAHTRDVHLQIEALLAQLEQRIEHPDDLRPVDLTSAMTPGNSRALAALQRPITVKLIDVPLRGVCERLSTILDVPVLLDTAALDALRDGGELDVPVYVRPIADLPVTVVADGQPLADVLQWPPYIVPSESPSRGMFGVPAGGDDGDIMLGGSAWGGLGGAFIGGHDGKIILSGSTSRAMAHVWDEVIWITASASAPCSLRIYPVADLPPDPPHRWTVRFLGASPPYELLAELMPSSVVPESFTYGGGRGLVEPLGDALAVYQRPDVHDEIERLIGQLRELLASAGQGVSQYAASAAGNVEAALAERSSYEAFQLPLAELAAQWGRKHDIEIVVHERSLADLGESAETPVTFRAENASLEQALYRMLTPHGLTFVVLDDRLVITTDDWAEEITDIRLYDVRHLVDPVVGVVEAWELGEHVTSCTSPRTWVDAGGAGSVEYYAGILVVDQRRDVHQEVALLLDALTHYQQHPDSLAAIPVASVRHADVDKLAGALQQTVSFKYSGVRLDRVAEDLSRQFAVPIVVEERGDDYFVDVHARNISLAAALDLMLRDVELEFVLRFGQVVICEPRWHTNDMLTRIYPVRDLFYYPAKPPDPPHGTGFSSPYAVGASRALVDYDTFLDTLTTAVQPDTWMEAGGLGSVDYCEGALVVSQSWQVHQRIERLLAQMRHALWPDRHPDPGPMPVDRVFARRTTLDANGVRLQDFLAEVARQQEITAEYTRPGPYFQTTLGQLIWLPSPRPPPADPNDPFGGGGSPPYRSLDEYLRWLLHRRPKYWAAPADAAGDAESVGFDEIVALHPLDLWLLRGAAWAAERLQFELRPDEPTVRCHFEDVPLGDALHELLAPLRHVLCSDGEVVHVYSADDASRPLITRVYDVRKLAPPVPPVPIERYRRPMRPFVTGPIPIVGDPDAELPPAAGPVDVARWSDLPAQGGGDFANFVVGHLSDQTRRLASDDGTVMMYQGLLVVRHDWHVHREIAALLDELSEAIRDLPAVERLINDKGPDGLDRLFEAMRSAQHDRVLAYLVYLFQNVEPAGRRRQAIERWKNADDPEIREAGIVFEKMITEFEKRISEDGVDSAASIAETSN